MYKILTKDLCIKFLARIYVLNFIWKKVEKNILEKKLLMKKKTFLVQYILDGTSLLKILYVNLYWKFYT